MKKEIMDYAFFKNLTRLPSIESIYLFGSRARGNHRTKSDIDLAIKCPQATIKEWSEIMYIIENADTLLNIDCIRLDTLKNPDLLATINKDKKLLYKKDQ